MQKSDPAKRFSENVRQLIVGVNFLNDDFTALNALLGVMEASCNVLTLAMEN